MVRAPSHCNLRRGILISGVAQLLLLVLTVRITRLNSYFIGNATDIVRMNPCAAKQLAEFALTFIPSDFVDVGLT